MTGLWYIASTLLLAVVTAESVTGSICLWQEARAGVVRDSLYIEGGLYSTWQDGKCKTTQRHYGSLFQLNFSTPFDGGSNLTRLFTPLNETVDPSAATYVNGFMVADNEEWYTFGGQAYPTVDQYSILSGITRGALYSPNPTASKAPLGYTPNYQAKGNISNKYISNGAGISVPSESLGFYFSGLRSANSSNLSYVPSTSGYDAPTTLVSTMLKVDTSVFGESTWSNIPLPSNINPRAEATLAWIPAGPKGALVIVGGVPYPADLPLNFGCYLNSTITTSNKNQGSSFMSNVTIYDVASGRWYVQPTGGNPPPQLAQACAVVATSPDNTTHNIHVYGGYNGVDSSGASDDVWILSVPAFTWVKAAAGVATHGRYSHVCAKPYPDQMIVVGGTNKCGNSLDTSAIIDVFNLNTLKWTGTYDPSKWSQYTVPSVVSDAIKTSPTASMESGLLSLFQSPYPSTLPQWYPYVSTPKEDVNPPAPKPSWVIPVVASIAGVVGLAALVLTIWCCRSRSKKAATGTSQSRQSIFSWMRGHPQSSKSQRSDDEMTQVEQSPGIGPGPHEIFGDTYFKPAARTTIAELNSNSNPHSQLTSPHPSSAFSSPNRPPWSPASELQAEVPRYELPAEPQVSSNTPVFKSHPYHQGIGGQAGTAPTPSVSVSSPSQTVTDPITPYELPKNRSDEELLPSPPEDMVLNQSTKPTKSAPAKHPGVTATPIPEEQADEEEELTDGAISPETSTGAVSPELVPFMLSIPRTPPTQTTRAHSHNRNNSSLDSGLTNLSSPTPQEDQRRSVALAALPDSPDASNPHRPGFTAAVNANIEERMRKDVQRKQVPNRPRGDASAYQENTDLYGNGRSTL